jgi:hypothetical protein
MYTWSLVSAGLPNAYSPAAARDLMSYCTPTWISDYNYQAILQWRGTNANGTVTRSAAPAPPCDCLVVWGSDAGGELRLEPSFAARTRATMPARGGSYVLRGERLDGSEVFSHAFEPAEVDHAPGVRQFTLAIPVGVDERAALARLILRGPDGRTVELRARRALLRPGTTPAPVAVHSLRRLTDGDLEVQWNASDYPGAIVRDARTGTVLAIGRTGRTRVRDAGRPIELLLSDGVRTTAVAIGTAAR